MKIVHFQVFSRADVETMCSEIPKLISTETKCMLDSAQIKCSDCYTNMAKTHSPILGIMGGEHPMHTHGTCSVILIYILLFINWVGFISLAFLSFRTYKKLRKGEGATGLSYIPTSMVSLLFLTMAVLIMTSC